MTFHAQRGRLIIESRDGYDFWEDLFSGETSITLGVYDLENGGGEVGTIEIDRFLNHNRNIHVIFDDSATLRSLGGQGLIGFFNALFVNPDTEGMGTWTLVTDTGDDDVMFAAGSAGLEAAYEQGSTRVTYCLHRNYWFQLHGWS
jgi:hypothetical protein